MTPAPVARTGHLGLRVTYCVWIHWLDAAGKGFRQRGGLTAERFERHRNSVHPRVELQEV